MTPEGVLRVDCGLQVTVTGRYLTIQTNTRRLALYAPTARVALEWQQGIREFYNVSPRTTPQPHSSSFPPREAADSVEVFTCARDYFMHVAVALLLAREEIFISSWKLSPHLLLTRPPLPPIRLSQILKYKADQGVSIRVLLYKEVELSGQGNNSLHAKKFLENLSPNIRCLRHPNKIFGNSRAILWSHHEKLVIIDRCTAFVGGLDLAFNRYDDFQHSLVDEDGVMYPGPDYRQHAVGLFQPVRSIHSLDKQQKREEEHVAVIHQAEVNFTSTTVSHLPIDEVSVRETTDYGWNGTWEQRNEVEESMHGPPAFYENMMRGSDHEGFGEPETAQEEAARLEAEEYVEAVPYGELDVLEGEPTQSGGLLNGLLGLFGALGNALEDALGSITVRGEENRPDVRELFPRQAWHDVHAVVHGQAARDISSHFVERWNFHRLSKNELDMDIILDISDDPYNGQCARCGCVHIHERELTCPRCGLALGPGSKYGVRSKDDVKVDDMKSLTELKLPDFPSSFSFIVFECSFVDKLGCTLVGNGPVAIEKVVNTPCVLIPGTLYHAQGEYSQSLVDRGLLPSIGDIVLSVDGVGVGHLSSQELKRFIVRRFAAQSRGSMLHVVFRRHFSQGIVNIYKSLADMQNKGEIEIQNAPSQQCDPSAVPAAPLLQSSNSFVGKEEIKNNGIGESYISYPPTESNVVYADHDPQASLHDVGDRYSSIYPTLPDVNGSQQQYHTATAAAEYKVEVSRYAQEFKDIPPTRSSTMANATIHYTSEARAPTATVDSITAPSCSVPPSFVANIGVDEINLHQDYTHILQPEATDFDEVRTTDIVETEIDVNIGATHIADCADVADRKVEVNDISDADRNTSVVESKIEVNVGVTRITTRGDVADRKEDADDISETDRNTYVGKTEIEVNPGSTVCGDVIDRNDDEADANTVMEGVDTVMEGVSPAERENDLILPDVPTSVPDILFPEAPVSRGIDIAEDSREVVSRTVAMSGRREPSSNTNYTDNGMSMTEESSVPLSRAVPVPDTRRRLSSNASRHYSTSSSGHDQRPTLIPELSPMYVPEDVFPPGKRDYTCTETIDLESKLSMSVLAHENLDLPGPHCPIPPKSTGTCQIQVLRSAGLWSVGATTERSIQNAWVEAITSAKHLIYIENQFFIGEPQEGSNRVQNSIVSALLERLVKAALSKENFRVIVVIPQHPSGDFVNHESPRIILYYEFLSICRGGSSLIESFMKRCPGVDPSDFIGFYCLRNWGVLNDKLVTEQIYVHDKIIIVDDRVAIIGSANINDRSMMGDRDSEIAIRIEDSLPVDICLGGRRWQAGALPHMLRMNLMRAHVGDNNPCSDGLVDCAVHSGGSDTYHMLWRDVATRNSEIYDHLDGDLSVYKCKTLQEYRYALKNFCHRSYLDSQVQDTVSRIQGHLVLWPMDFLKYDDLSPAASTKVLVPLDLWL
eukprot:CAMPEP_0185035158 /NCGR_PEP_ID=MMETSP1103-20130426/25973_1 /TAXON_ID=36769 /ORGANISM="Paraphysomonas bandaiensis, Strain Caron Lab Isolate" /LENGTH=1446 /DNA_ID=CAMNT_0027572105 /DNA_START=681 /DNA_END=5021 /DNA_ORIENTATION=+